MTHPRRHATLHAGVPAVTSSRPPPPLLLLLPVASPAGHYYAYVCGSDGRWACQDDSVSQRVTLETVLWSRSGAYMLFYVR